jgi:site-specific recombinase XerD
MDLLEFPGMTDDLAAVQTFLDMKAGGSQATRRSYSHHLLQLMLWLRLKHPGRELADIRAADLLDYAYFLHRPDPDWVQTTDRNDGNRMRLADGTLNPDWRPLRGPLSPKSVVAAMRTVKSFYRFLFESNYMVANPGAMISPTAIVAYTEQRDAETRHAVDPQAEVPAAPDANTFFSGNVWNRHERAHQARRHALPKDLVAFLLDRLVPGDGEPEHIQRRQWRQRFILTLLYFTGLRIDEACRARYEELERVPKEDGRVIWWLHVVGKGRRKGKVPLNSRVLEALGDYRQSVDAALPRLPGEGETGALIWRENGDRNGVGNQQLRKMVSRMFDAAARDAAKAELPEADVRRLEQATSHWLRHSRATHSLDSGLPFPEVQKLLRHEHMTTTAIYVHADDDALAEAHEEATKL